MSGEMILKAGATTIALVTGDAEGGVVGIGEILRSAVADRFPNATERLQGAVAAEVEHVALQEFPELVRRVERLQHEIGRRPTFEEVRTILDGFAKAQTNALGDKRRMVRNALHNAFDPELYEQALSARLLAVLDELDYGDLHYLKQRGQGDGVPYPWEKPAQMACFHANRLVNAGLIARHVRSLRDMGTTDEAMVSEFGRRMLQLIREPPPLDGEAEGDASAPE